MTIEPDPFVHAFLWPIAGRAVTAAVTLGVFDALEHGAASPAGSPRRSRSTHAEPRRCSLH